MALLAGATVTATTSAVAVEKKGKAASTAVKAMPVQEAKQVEPMSSDEVKANLEYIDKLAKSVQTCQILHQSLTVMLDSTINIKVISAEMGMRGRRLSEMARKTLENEAASEANIPGAVQSCIARNNDETVDPARGFIRAFKDEKLKGKAKETVAQWMTALASSGTDNFGQESSKFKTLANGLKFDLSLD
ncbi:hypothetical protein D3872_19815 [Massilia cavernae]|uniref:Uncharacterized protein n=2 Tax=Massilia cavernae TaxID=2320864 RepID=A0A418XFZ2_9BURK|nr:hypothetical protein D3872_19815 [Massilia cavernae]